MGPAVILGSLAVSSVQGFAQVPSFPPEEELRGRKAGEFATRLGEYAGGAADWGFLFVPENRARPDSRLLRLVMVRQRARGEDASPPIFNLVGGPGESNVWASGELAAGLLEHNDVVRVGYRGIDSDVELLCPEFTQALQTNEPLSDASIKKTRKALRACNDRLRAEGVDVDGYNLAEVVGDIEDARKALGYERIDFLAVSWGTQIAYAYAMKYPERVRRMLLVGAGGRARGFDLWSPQMVERKLRAYAELWKQDPEASARSADLLASVRRALAGLPQTWRGVPIDRDKVRLAAWHMLRETREAAQMFDAFVAADQGDYGGLALLSMGYDDELRKESQRKHGPYHGEFFSKVMSSGLDPDRDWVREMDAEGVLGSPAAKLLWGAASKGGWPIKPVPSSYRRDAAIDAQCLVVMGDLDASSPVEYAREELMPRLKRGRLVVLSHMGHTEFVRVQHQAFERLATRFFLNGEVDSSRFVHQPIDFSPENSLVRQARELVPEERK